MLSKCSHFNEISFSMDVSQISPLKKMTKEQKAELKIAKNKINQRVYKAMGERLIKIGLGNTGGGTTGTLCLFRPYSWAHNMIHTEGNLCATNVSSSFSCKVDVYVS